MGRGLVGNHFNLQGDPSGRLLAFVDIKLDVVVSIRSLYCDGTYVLMSTQASNESDGSP